jgi:hypothetical protein
MKRILMAIGILLICQLALAEELPDTPGNRLAAAERYLEVVPMDEMIADSVKKTSMNLPENQRRAYVNFMTQSVRVDVFGRAAVASMARHFTVRELNALADFYGSPEGRSVMKKFGDYMADIMPVLQQELQRGYQKYQATQQ